MPRSCPLVATLIVCAAGTPAWAEEDGKLLERARDQLESAVRFNPADFRARALLGRAYALQGIPDKALEQYRKAASLGDVGAQLLAADVLADRGETQAALDAYESVRLAARRSGDLLRAAEAELGIAQVDLLRGAVGKVLDAAKRLQGGDKQVAARLRPRLAALEAAARAGLVLAEGPLAVWTEGARARETLERVAADDGEPRVLYALGRFYLEAPPGFGDAERAESLMGRAARLRKANAVYRAWYIRTLIVRGKESDARQELQAFEAAFATSPAARAMAERLGKGEAPF